MRTEYLIPIDTKGQFVKSIKGFNSLLMANEEIEIEKEKIKYKDYEFDYKLQKNSIENTTINCYHLIVENKIEFYEFDSEDIEVKKYLELLRIIKTTFLKGTKEYEVLWDDISFYCSQKAYPLIYEIENLMRKLLTKFMLVNVGGKWEKENIPSKIDKTKNRVKKMEQGNSLLYQLDFVELATFLFEPYSIKDSLSDINSLVENKDEKIFEILDQYIPKSNWDRYFKKIVLVEDEHLQKQWRELYELRCKVAHNRLFGLDDLKRVTTIVNELKIHINKAIEELDRITIPEEEKESISMNLALNSNDELLNMIKTYNVLADLLHEMYFEQNNNQAVSYKKISLNIIIHYLKDKHIIDDKDQKELQYIIQKRNALIHSTKNIEKDEIVRLIDYIEKIIFKINNKENGEDGVDKTDNSSMQ
ncbi:hypothetical protein I260019D6_12820 [Dorea longicatena]|uniref:hypothetical protein n=1 Tax=Dorea longicatena TaxID=88431 RepID=UPI0036F441AF